MTDSPREYRRDEFTICTDRSRLDLAAIHAFLSTSYWASGIPRQVVRRSIDHSLCFGIYAGPRQVGFARVVTDQATFAYLADVYVVEEYRGRGLARWLLECILGHPALQGLPALLEVPGPDGHGPNADEIKKLRELHRRATK
jgi:GNAT superfamily N-acetyltransferase